MKPLLNLVILLCILVPFLRASLEKSFKRNQFEIIMERVVDVLPSCVRFTGYDFITLLTDSKKRLRIPSKFFDFFSVLEIKSLISDNKTIEIPPNILDLNKSHKVEIILAIVSSPTVLQYFLNELKQSELWNECGFYLIVDAETLEKNCERAYDFLQISWKNDIIRSTFFCTNVNSDILIYTFNPYKKWAPGIWHEAPEESKNKSANDNWTLYNQKLINNQTTCSDLDFQKDLIMSGQEIKAIAVPIPPTLTIHPNKTGWAKYDGIQALITKTLVTKMNASLRLTLVDDSAKTYFYSNSNEIAARSIFDILGSGEQDILLNGLYIINKPRNTSFLYPHIKSGLSLVTRYTGFETVPSKILHFMNPKLIIGMCLIFLATVMILGVLAGEGVIFASLEVLRIMLGVTLVRMPRRIPLRIYLITVIFLFLITGSTFQSSLSSLLTSPIALHNIDNMEDLLKANCSVYVFREYTNVIANENLLPRIVPIDNWNCTRYVLENENAACAAERLRLVKISVEQKLYFSKRRLVSLDGGFAVRPSWPLYSRLSKLLMWLREFGLIDHWVEWSLWVYKPKWLVKQRVTKSRDYRPMTVADFEFAFYILFIGLTCSIIVFLIERFIWKKHCEQPKKRNLKLPPLFDYIE